MSADTPVWGHTLQTFADALGLSKRTIRALVDNGEIRAVRFGSIKKPIVRLEPPAEYLARRLHVLLRREGHTVNRKRVQRLYREERLPHQELKRLPVQPTVGRMGDRPRFSPGQAPAAPSCRR